LINLSLPFTPVTPIIFPSFPAGCFSRTL
jgi:hypothetical protein